MIKNIKHKRP